MSATKDDRTIRPYLFFNGSCEQAIEFYRKALGAEVEALARFKDSPEPHPSGTIPPGFENKIMHANSASDRPPSWHPTAALPRNQLSGLFALALRPQRS
jgi:hypothetical protein